MKVSRRMKWPLRMVAIMSLVGLLDIVVMLFALRPLPWTILIPSLSPLLTVIFVIVPMLKEQKR